MALVTGLVASTSAVLAESTDADWVLVKITAGSTGAVNVSLHQVLQGNQDPHAPEVFGSGLGSSRHGGFVFVHAGPGGPPTISTASGFGSLHVEAIDPPGPNRTGISSATTFLGSFDPGDQLAALHFQTSVRWDTIEVTSVRAEEGSVTWEVITGTGATALAQADPQSEGRAVSVGSTALGSSLQRHDVSTGIVGGFDWSTCLQCAGRWSGPGDTSGTWTASSRPTFFGPTESTAEGALSFAGPAGTWEWAWDGMSSFTGECLLWRLRTATFGAWAPIGDDYSFFTMRGLGRAWSSHWCATGV
ncbi:MAG: hypothetical protein ACRDJM_00350 [Actinomycetota bacterium]